MTQPPRNEMTPNAVVLNLMKLSRQIGELADSLDKLEEEAVNRREDFTLVHSKAFLRAEGAMDVRKYTAIAQTHDERLAAELAEMKVRNAKRQIDTLRVRVDVGRSAAALVRAEAELLNIRGRN